MDGRAAAPAPSSNTLEENHGETMGKPWENASKSQKTSKKTGKVGDIPSNNVFFAEGFPSGYVKIAKMAD
jgi:hypothetical protein